MDKHLVKSYVTFIGMESIFTVLIGLNLYANEYQLIIDNVLLMVMTYEQK